MNPNPISSASERSSKPSLRARARNQIVKARSWLGKLVSFPFAFRFARVLMIFVIGFAAGVAWQSYGGEVRKTIASWSPHLSWLAPPVAVASSERLKTMSLALAAARQNLDKLATEMSRLPAQEADTPRRRANR